MTIRTPTKHTYYYFVIKNLKGLKIRKKKSACKTGEISEYGIQIASM